MEGPPTVDRPPPPFPAPPRSVDFSALEFVLSILALITIPALIYTFFFAVKCPPCCCRRRRRRSHADRLDAAGIGDIGDDIEIVTEVKYEKEAHVKEVGTECPVCLSVFADGEEIKTLSACKHSFHASCINMWLNSHSNCPVCRASVPVKRPKTTPRPARTDNDHHQGLPDAGSLV